LCLFFPRPFLFAHSLASLLLSFSSLASSVRCPQGKLAKEKRDCGRIEGMRRPLLLLLSSSKTHEPGENPLVKLSP
jgi:hypothetical protein